jgi:hypothetical protein
VGRFSYCIMTAGGYEGGTSTAARATTSLLCRMVPNLERALTVELEAESRDAHPRITLCGWWVGVVMVKAASSG